jgi:hypothetical protein
MTSSGLSDPTKIAEVDRFCIKSGIPAAQRPAMVEIDFCSYAALRGATCEGEVERKVEEARRGGEKSPTCANCVLSSSQGPPNIGGWGAPLGHLQRHDATGPQMLESV